MKVVLKLRYVQSSCVYQLGKSFKSCGMYISSCVYQRGKSFKSCGMYLTSVFINGESRYVYIIMCLSIGKVISKLR